MKFSKEMLKLYAVTDRSWLRGRTLEECVEAALRGGVTMVQLREKTMSEDEFEAEAIRVKAICARFNVPLIINDNVELAKKIDADGVHVGQSDAEASYARALLGPDKIVGVTAKTPEQVDKAVAAGADYLGSGAVFGSSTKTDALPMTPEFFQSICEYSSVPVVAIGGINGRNIESLKGRKMSGFAVVSGIFASDDIEKDTAELYKKATAALE